MGYGNVPYGTGYYKDEDSPPSWDDVSGIVMVVVSSRKAFLLGSSDGTGYTGAIVTELFVEDLHEDVLVA